MAHTLERGIREMENRYLRNRRDVICPWSPENAKRKMGGNGAAPNASVEYTSSRLGQLMKYNMIPMANWVLFMVDCLEHFFDVHEQHAPAICALFTAMCTHKGGGKRPHLILWGSHGISKSFIITLCENLMMPHVIIKRTHVSKQHLFGDADNRDSPGACCIFANDEAKPADVGMISKDQPGAEADIASLKEKLTNHTLTSQYLDVNPKTGKRDSKTRERSNENTMICAMNKTPTFKDQALASRWSLRHLTRISRYDKQSVSETADPVAYKMQQEIFQYIDFTRTKIELAQYCGFIEHPYMETFIQLFGQFYNFLFHNCPFSMVYKTRNVAFQRLRDNALCLAKKMVTSNAVFLTLMHPNSKFFNIEHVTTEAILEMERFMVFPSSMFPFAIDMTADQYFSPMWILLMETLAHNTYRKVDMSKQEQHYNYGLKSTQAGYKDYGHTPYWWLWESHDVLYESDNRGMRPPVFDELCSEDMQVVEGTAQDTNLKRTHRYVVLEFTDNTYHHKNELCRLVANKVVSAITSDPPSVEYFEQAIYDLSEHNVCDAYDPAYPDKPLKVFEFFAYKTPNQKTRHVIGVNKFALTVAFERNQNVVYALNNIRHKYTLPGNNLLCRPSVRKIDGREYTIPQFLETLHVPEHDAACALMRVPQFKAHMEERRQRRIKRNGTDIDFDFECAHDDVFTYEDDNGVSHLANCTCFRKKTIFRVRGKTTDEEERQELEERQGHVPEAVIFSSIKQDASIDDESMLDFFSNRLGYKDSDIKACMDMYHPVRSATYWLDTSADLVMSYPNDSIAKWKQRMDRAHLATSKTATSTSASASTSGGATSNTALSDKLNPRLQPPPHKTTCADLTMDEAHTFSRAVRDQFRRYTQHNPSASTEDLHRELKTCIKRGANELNPPCPQLGDQLCDAIAHTPKRIKLMQFIERNA